MIIKRKYYSDFTPSALEQREYSIISELRRSGVKRVYKKYVGRARKSAAQKIQDSIDKDIDKYSKAINKYMTAEKVINPELEKKMVKEAEKRGARVLNKDIDGIGGSYTAKADVAKKGKIATDQEIGDAKYVVTHPEGRGAEILGHEVGHVDNMEAGKKLYDIPGKIRRAISKKANDPKVRGEMNLSTTYYDNDGSIGIKEAYKRFLKKKAIDIEEANASKNSIKFLKKNGADSDDIKIAKKSLGRAEDTYKHLNKKYYKVPIMNKIQIPSRRPKKVDLEKQLEEIFKNQ